MGIVDSICSIFDFKELLDNDNNRYILLSSSSINEISSVRDRTEFEAIENHIHLFDKVLQRDLMHLERIGTILGKALFDVLSVRYPLHFFYVYVTISVSDSMIIRFHQRWENESPYYNPDDFTKDTDRIICFCSGSREPVNAQYITPSSRANP